MKRFHETSNCLIEYSIYRPIKKGFKATGGEKIEYFTLSKMERKHSMWSKAGVCNYDTNNKENEK